MQLDNSSLVFIDASCLIDMTRSSQSDSERLISLCIQRRFKGAISHLVLFEAEQYIVEKFGWSVFSTYHARIASMPFVLAPVPIASPFQQTIEQLVHQDRVNALASALAISAHYFLTLDAELVVKINKLQLPIQAFTPDNFIKPFLLI